MRDKLVHTQPQLPERRVGAPWLGIVGTTLLGSLVMLIVFALALAASEGQSAASLAVLAILLLVFGAVAMRTYVAVRRSGRSVSTGVFVAGASIVAIVALPGGLLALYIELTSS
jgi:hypothetical protein